MSVAAILLQTLFFKFTGAEESVYIFSTLGMEPFGRYASGVAELGLFMQQYLRDALPVQFSYAVNGYR